MMSTFWKTKKFSEMNQKWAQKLLESGFNDIEKYVDGELVLKQQSSNVLRTSHPVYVESRIEFFDTILKKLHVDRQMTKRDRIIMTRYADGIKQKEIICELLERGMGCQRITITRTISRYLHKWGIPILKPRKTK